MIGDLVIAAAWPDSLRAYPRWLVLLCAATVLGGALVCVARPLKWTLYAGLGGVFGFLLAALAWWLEQ